MSTTTITMINATVKLVSMRMYTGTVHASDFAMADLGAARMPSRHRDFAQDLREETI